MKMGQHESQDFSIVTKECHFYEIIIVHTFRKKKSCFNIWNRALRVLPKVKMVNFFEKGQFSDFWDNFNHFQTLYEERYFAHYVIELQSPLTNGQMNQWTTWHPLADLLVLSSFLWFWFFLWSFEGFPKTPKIVENFKKQIRKCFLSLVWIKSIENRNLKS